MNLGGLLWTYFRNLLAEDREGGLTGFNDKLGGYITLIAGLLMIAAFQMPITDDDIWFWRLGFTGVWLLFAASRVYSKSFFSKLITEIFFWLSFSNCFEEWFLDNTRTSIDEYIFAVIGIALILYQHRRKIFNYGKRKFKR